MLSLFGLVSKVILVGHLGSQNDMKIERRTWEIESHKGESWASHKKMESHNNIEKENPKGMIGTQLYTQNIG